MTGKFMLMFMLLASLAKYIMAFAYQAYGIRPIFTAVMLVVTFWTGYYLWQGPRRSARPPQPTSSTRMPGLAKNALPCRKVGGLKS